MYLIALFAVAIWHATVYQPIDDISIHQMDKYIYMYMHSTCKFSAISPSHVRYFWQKIPRLQLTFHLQTKFHVYDRRTGQLLKQKFESPSISFLHSPNAYELDGHLIMDMFVLKKFTTKGKLLVGWPIVGISLVWITLQMDYVC